MKTKEEVNEKFKEANVYFSRYYKYTFTFVCQSEDGYKLICNYGGDSNEIYRFEVSNSPEPFGECDNWSRVMVLDSNDKEVFSESFDW